LDDVFPMKGPLFEYWTLLPIGLLVAGISAASCQFALWLRGAFIPTSSPRVRVGVSQDDVTYGTGAGCIERMKWSELTRVYIRTTYSGAVDTVRYIVLVGHDRTMTIPRDADGIETLLTSLHGLDGFNAAAVIKAFDFSSPATFPCWSRKLQTKRKRRRRRK
jgi:hypothetical protein